MPEVVVMLSPEIDAVFYDVHFNNSTTIKNRRYTNGIDSLLHVSAFLGRLNTKQCLEETMLNYLLQGTWMILNSCFQIPENDSTNPKQHKRKA